MSISDRWFTCAHCQIHLMHFPISLVLVGSVIGSVNLDLGLPPHHARSSQPCPRTSSHTIYIRFMSIQVYTTRLRGQQRTVVKNQAQALVLSVTILWTFFPCNKATAPPIQVCKLHHSSHYIKDTALIYQWTHIGPHLTLQPVQPHLPLQAVYSVSPATVHVLWFCVICSAILFIITTVCFPYISEPHTIAISLSLWILVPVHGHGHGAALTEGPGATYSTSYVLYTSPRSLERGHCSLRWSPAPGQWNFAHNGRWGDRFYVLSAEHTHWITWDTSFNFAGLQDVKVGGGLELLRRWYPHHLKEILWTEASDMILVPLAAFHLL